MLLLSKTADAWKTAGPVTKITDSPYPFNKNTSRPTAKEVRYEMYWYSVLCKIKIMMNDIRLARMGLVLIENAEFIYHRKK